MSQKDDSESDIWDYKPLGKRKKRRDSPSTPSTKTKRRCTVKKTSKKETSVCVKSPGRGGGCITGGHSSADVQSLPPVSPPAHGNTDTTSDGSSSGDFCPICQMPFSILLGQSQRWHVAECLDSPRDTCEECPDGLQCSSTIPNHYKKFNHTFLAHSRANGDTALLSLPQQAGASGNNSCPPGRPNNELNGSVLESSQDSFPTSTPPTGTPSSTPKNGLMLLRSPRPEDLKKKKGWSPHSKKQKSVSSSQESRVDLPSTPVQAESVKQACENVPKRDPSPNNLDEISYSPLSELPTETEGQTSECRKALFDQNGSGNESEDSVLLFNDCFSSEDELLTEFIDNLETHSQVQPVNSGPPTNQPPAGNTPDATGGTEASGAASSIQSPQSIVLERLRETLRNSASLPLKSLNDSSIQSERPHTASPVVPSSQTCSSVRGSSTMPPLKAKNKAGQASGLKQTDIGVFFGLKPLKQEEKEEESGPSEPSVTQVPTLGENSGQRKPRKPRQPRQRKDRSETTAEASQGVETVDTVKEEAPKGRSRGWGGRGGRWRKRVNADGEVELPRCPFYKKIPGTKFVVDAFQYGEIEGITAYFLTHFHSDHYGGLTKNSTVPIYCNKITGNLVRSKLRVAEEKIHILPMNTAVTVEGVKVVLLDANHCPGAAMLLFFLPDGQTVLHTGDFRADPSMETYPELLGCRVQTLYLDTTYCSPEYTFPRQQEVINFAANRAFELVTLHPRTLVVCGSYSVGKEKVFLALAEILGSKVCLSRDKFNTMCCLESEQVRQSITTDCKAARVHVLPMMQLTFKKLQDYLARFSKQYDQLVAFKPTGWTFSQQVDSVEDIQPQINGNISIYGIPYSEHSSYLEIKRFVQWLRPLKIIPTVNNGSWASRKAMERCFSEWLSEKEAKR